MHYLWAMETLTQILVDWGYGGLFVAAAIAGSVVPFSSEAVLAVLLGMGARSEERRVGKECRL